MNKLDYEYYGTIYSIDRKLADTWMKREGIKEDSLQFHNAMKSIMINAEGRLNRQETPLTKEAMEQAMEELIKEEIELTGGQV